MHKNTYVFAIVLAIIVGSLFFEGSISSSQVKEVPVIIRDDDGEMDNYIKLGNVDVYTTKYLDAEVHPRNYDTAELYIYGKASDCSEMPTGKHIQVEISNPRTTEYMQFDPCDKFDTEWSWVILDIPIDALKLGTNSFKFKNVQHLESFGDILYIGYDTDTTSDRSRTVSDHPGEEIRLTHDFENMIYLKLS